jgi:hypothetical protein
MKMPGKISTIYDVEESNAVLVRRAGGCRRKVLLSLEGHRWARREVSRAQNRCSRWTQCTIAWPDCATCCRASKDLASRGCANLHSVTHECPVVWPSET